VRDEEGRPIAEAVVLIADGPSHPDMAALTGGEGEYSYIRLAPGTYTLLVNAVDREPLRLSVDVAAGQTAQLDFDLP
jgi:hypothetical protein